MELDGDGCQRFMKKGAQMMNDAIDPYCWDPYVDDPADADADGTCCDPDRNEIRKLLVKYFDPPITDEVVDRVEADYRKVRSSRRDRLYHARYYGATTDSTRWRGMTWYEDLNGAERSLSLSDLVLMRADVLSDADPSFPRPRRFCPVFCVGTWEQITPAPPMGERYLWHLSPDGTFRCDDPEVPSALTRWCVHRRPGFGFDLMLQREHGRDVDWMMGHIRLHATEMVARTMDLPFRLHRVSRRCAAGSAPTSVGGRVEGAPS